MSISYSDGFKYQTRSDSELFVGVAFALKEDIVSKWITLTADGWLFIKHGYAWDGSSGPTFDTRNTMRGSLVHDALYELIRKEFLPPSAKSIADQLYYDYLITDGVWKMRAKWHYVGTRWKGKSSTLPSHKKEILYAP